MQRDLKKDTKQKKQMLLDNTRESKFAMEGMFIFFGYEIYY